MNTQSSAAKPLHGFPASAKDPRLSVAGILFCYLLAGVTLLGFNRSPLQILLVISMACGFDVLLHRTIFKQWLFPLSALITGMSLSILVNYAHGSWLPAIPVFMAIASKYIFTFNGRHVYNPALFGIVSALVLGGNMLSVSPAYQWGGYPAMAFFVVTAAIISFGLRIQRLVLVGSFLGLYFLALLVRAWLTQHHVPPETVLLGALTSPAFYLFAFFMITDPATSPVSKRGQFLAAFCVVGIDFYLHTREALYTFFYAGFIFFTLRWLWLHTKNIIHCGIKEGVSYKLTGSYRRPLLTALAIGATGGIFLQLTQLHGIQKPVDFKLVAVPVTHTGLQADDGRVIEQADPRIKNVAKWVLSVGDAVAVADYDQDGLQDIFLSYPLKATDARGGLYKNLGDFRFERIAIPAIAERMSSISTGLPSTAVWFDHDNDGDRDLMIGMAYGNSILLRNNLLETGTASFTDISSEAGIDDYAISITANAFDADNDGDLDLMVGNSLNPWLPDYDQPTPLNVFDLPQPEYESDRRMYNFMHRTWHNADNGGENYFYLNNNGKFTRQNSADSGLTGNRWTIDIGTGDLDQDGDTDLYLANDFGPDEIFINTRGKFNRILGHFSGHPGRDTYKGMNASLADFDNNGATDIYVSNVHEPLQAEGSMLWMNDGTLAKSGWRALKDQATVRNTLNEHRFGWGAAAVDINLDGQMDILQANGMVGDTYDKLYEGCPDYWYWNDQIALTGPDVHGYADQWADLSGRCIFPNEPDRVMLNQGRYFVDVALQAGWQDRASSRGIATADFDNDGDPDVIVSRQFQPAAVFDNVANHDRSWIGFDLHGNGSTCNRDAVGSRITLTAGNKEQTAQLREITTSNGFSAQNDQRQLFGLAQHTDLLTVEVNWCGRETHTYRDLAVNKYHQLTQLPQVTALDTNPSLDR